MLAKGDLFTGFLSIPDFHEAWGFLAETLLHPQDKTGLWSSASKDKKFGVTFGCKVCEVYIFLSIFCQSFKASGACTAHRDYTIQTAKKNTFPIQSYYQSRGAQFIPAAIKLFKAKVGRSGERNGSGRPSSSWPSAPVGPSPGQPAPVLPLPAPSNPVPELPLPSQPDPAAPVDQLPADPTVPVPLGEPAAPTLPGGTGQWLSVPWPIPAMGAWGPALYWSPYTQSWGLGLPLAFPGVTAGMQGAAEGLDG
ncbi:translation initiation factor IF-2-like [Hemicordylus capensis]|uniref:translation initiation factor IF-2-like n=1 Tax=Hemicordylus capensis TaxID=884348 RepID=UPI002304C7B2|nr:translation initiation factor IF-2-like [Hemicordylus capensis]